MVTERDGWEFDADLGSDQLRRALQGRVAGIVRNRDRRSGGRWRRGRAASLSARAPASRDAASRAPESRATGRDDAPGRDDAAESRARRVDARWRDVGNAARRARPNPDANGCASAAAVASRSAGRSRRRSNHGSSAVAALGRHASSARQCVRRWMACATSSDWPERRQPVGCRRASCELSVIRSPDCRASNPRSSGLVWRAPDDAFARHAGLWDGCGDLCDEIRAHPRRSTRRSRSGMKRAFGQASTKRSTNGARCETAAKMRLPEFRARSGRAPASTR